jgi:hypothetical protein
MSASAGEFNIGSGSKNRKLSKTQAGRAPPFLLKTLVDNKHFSLTTNG